jgi:hypothetical protein
MKNDEDRPPIPPHRRPFLVLKVIFGLAAVVFLILYWAYPPRDAFESFEEAKITTARLDEEPFARMPLKPGDTFRSIEVMEQTEVKLTCEVVSANKEIKSRYFVEAFGQRMESDDCDFTLPIPSTVGTHYTLTISFHDGESEEPTDTLEIPAVVVGAGERVEVHALEDASGRSVKPGSVPEEVIVYGRGRFQLPSDSREYVALFFTADPQNNVPVLELEPVREGEQPRPLEGKVIRYRSWGKDLSGYAFWSTSPVRIGGPERDRTVTDIYIGIFPRAELEDIFRSVLKVETTGPETLTVTPLVASIGEVARRAVHGRLLTLPFHVVRGPAEVGVQSAN